MIPVNKIICGAMPEATKGFPDDFFDAIVTDPPYELGFMGKKWDTTGIAYNVPMWKQVLRVTKPGGFLLSFGATRTYHRLACAIEDAGWQIRDCLMWLYGSGFPKSLNISKAIDKAAGAERKKQWTPYTPECKRGVIGPGETRPWLVKAQSDGGRWEQTDIPATDLAQFWDGYGTALKPAWEPIIVAMKPLDGTFAQNAEKHGVAGLNIDGGRIGIGDRRMCGTTDKSGESSYILGARIETRTNQGRWPANLLLDEEAAVMLDRQQEGASRFFYCAKASRAERNAGLEGTEAKIGVRINAPRANEIIKTKPRQNHHPTVKPLKLMEYLCTLLKPPSEHPILLDPFCGSGTTLMAAFNTEWDYIGIDKEAEYVEIAKKRVAWCKEQRQGQQPLFPIDK